jgi:hypothetical protein
MPVNDRSTDGTREIIDRIAARGRYHPPFHRTKASPARRPH